MIKRYKVGVKDHDWDWGGSSNIPCLIESEDGSAVMYDDHCKELQIAMKIGTEDMEMVQAENARLREDVEACCDALEYLSSHATIGPAILANLDEAGRNEIEERRRYARKVLHNTNSWRAAEAELAHTATDASPTAKRAIEEAP